MRCNWGSQQRQQQHVEMGFVSGLCAGDVPKRRSSGIVCRCPCSRKVEESRAEEHFRIALQVNSMMGVAEFEERQILRALQEVLKKQVSKSG